MIYRHRFALLLPLALLSCGPAPSQDGLGSLNISNIFSDESLFNLISSLPAPHGEPKVLSSSVANYFTHLVEVSSDAPMVINGQTISGVRTGLLGLRGDVASLSAYPSVKGLWSSLGVMAKPKLTKTLVQTHLDDIVKAFKALPHNSGQSVGNGFKNGLGNLLALELIQGLGAVKRSSGLELMGAGCSRNCQPTVSEPSAGTGGSGVGPGPTTAPPVRPRPPLTAADLCTDPETADTACSRYRGPAGAGGGANFSEFNLDDY